MNCHRTQRGISTIEANVPSDEELHQIALLLADERLPEGWDIVASSKMARVVHHQKHGIYFKEFFSRSPLEKLKSLVKGSRAQRARTNSEQLLLAGFEAPKNLYWGTLPGGKEFLFTAAVPGEGVTHWLRKTLTGTDPETLSLKRQLLRELGIFIGRMHASGFIHGDLRSSNVLAHKVLDRFQFSLIDNERSIRQRPPAGKAILRNIMQLNMLLPSDVTRTDRLRFFQTWHSQMRNLSKLEAQILALEAYRWACTRLRAKGLIQ